MSVMSSVAKIFAKGGAFIKAHKTTICVCSGIVAYGGAVVECGHATVKSVKKVDKINKEREALNEPKLTKKEVMKECASNYIPTLGLVAAGTGLTLYGYKCTFKQLSVATAGAKLLETEYTELKESIEDVLGTGGTDENKDIKDKVLNRFAERKHKVYGDSSQPIDYYPAGGVSLDSFTKLNKIERFKDKFGGVMYGTRADIRYALEVMKNELREGFPITLDKFYETVDDHAQYPDNASWFEFNAEDTRYAYDQDITLTPDSDADGLFWRMHWREEPVYKD